MPLSQLRANFEQLKKLRKTDPQAALTAVGAFGADAVELLAEDTVMRVFGWRGMGTKNYEVAALPGSDLQFSRAINSDLFIPDPNEFRDGWKQLQAAILRSAGTGQLQGSHADSVNRVVYTAVVGYAAAVDLFNPGDRGGPGTFFEMMIGPTISLLAGRQEGAAIEISVPETGDTERVPTDLSFAGQNPEDVVLVIPAKISTRERISQAYVHQRILDAVHEDGGLKYRSVLAIANENNTMFPSKTARHDRSVDRGWTQETLVPGTIVLYHKYVSKLSGLYYLDPPNRYVLDPPETFPHVAHFSDLLISDLPGLLHS